MHSIPHCYSFAAFSINICIYRYFLNCTIRRDRVIICSGGMTAGEDAFEQVSESVLGWAYVVIIII